MKTLKEIAATFNMFTAQDVPAKYLDICKELPSHKSWSTAETIPELLLNNPNIEIDYFYQARVYNVGRPDQCNDIEGGAFILLKHVNSDLILMLHKDRNNKFHLDLPHAMYHKYHNISYHLRSNATKHLNKPNLVGVWTDKKLTDWINYCNEYYNCLEENYQEVTGANLKHEQEIKRVIDALQPCRVVERHDGRVDYTYIETEYFEVTARLQRDEKYLSFTTNFKGGIDGVIALTEHSKNV